jgi:hypothetical protein
LIFCLLKFNKFSTGNSDFCEFDFNGFVFSQATSEFGGGAATLGAQMHRSWQGRS